MATCHSTSFSQNFANLQNISSFRVSFGIPKEAIMGYHIQSSTKQSNPATPSRDRRRSSVLRQLQKQDPINPRNQARIARTVARKKAAAALREGRKKATESLQKIHKDQEYSPICDDFESMSPSSKSVNRNKLEEAKRKRMQQWTNIFKLYNLTLNTLQNSESKNFEMDFRGEDENETNKLKHARTRMQLDINSAIVNEEDFSKSCRELYFSVDKALDHIDSPQYLIRGKHATFLKYPMEELEELAEIKEGQQKEQETLQSEIKDIKKTENDFFNFAKDWQSSGKLSSGNSQPIPQVKKMKKVEKKKPLAEIRKVFKRK